MRTILGIIAVVSYGLAFIFVAISNHYNHKYYSEKVHVFLILAFIFFFLTFIEFIVFSYIPKPLNEQYEEKIEDVRKANDNLQKFLIEHPEFKTEGY